MKKTDEDRAVRLAEALRANLRRRKAQARDQETTGPAEPPPPPPPPPPPIAAPQPADPSVTGTTS